MKVITEVMFEYTLLIYIADDGPYGYAEFTTNTPVSVGDELYWKYNTKYEGMRLEVNCVSHDNGKTLLYCDYADNLDDNSMIESMVEIGVPIEWALSKPRDYQEWKDEKNSKQ